MSDILISRFSKKLGEAYNMDLLTQLCMLPIGYSSENERLKTATDDWLNKEEGVYR